MFYLYVLKSTIAPRHYIGITADITARLAYHNRGNVTSTKAYRPWKVAYSEAFERKTDARRRELSLKRTAKARKELFTKIDEAGPIV